MLKAKYWINIVEDYHVKHHAVHSSGNDCVCCFNGWGPQRFSTTKLDNILQPRLQIRLGWITLLTQPR